MVNTIIPQGDGKTEIRLDAGDTRLRSDFPFFNENDIAVLRVSADGLTRTDLVLNRDYTVTFSNDRNTRVIDLTQGAPEDDTLYVVYLNVPIQKQVRYDGNPGLDEELAHQTLMIKQIQDNQVRAPQYTIDVDLPQPILMPPVEGHVLLWEGGNLVNIDPLLLVTAGGGASGADLREIEQDIIRIDGDIASLKTDDIIFNNSLRDIRSNQATFSTNIADALSTAQEADTRSRTALSTAAGLSASVNTAVDEAGRAITTANSVSMTVNTFDGRLQGAEADATNALSLATDADTLARSLSNDVSFALTTANQAEGNAVAARQLVGTLSTAVVNLNGRVVINEAKIADLESFTNTFTADVNDIINAHDSVINAFDGKFTSLEDIPSELQNIYTSFDAAGDGQIIAKRGNVLIYENAPEGFSGEWGDISGIPTPITSAAANFATASNDDVLVKSGNNIVYKTFSGGGGASNFAYNDYAFTYDDALGAEQTVDLPEWQTVDQIKSDVSKGSTETITAQDTQIERVPGATLATVDVVGGITRFDDVYTIPANARETNTADVIVQVVFEGSGFTNIAIDYRVFCHGSVVTDWTEFSLDRVGSPTTIRVQCSDNGATDATVDIEFRQRRISAAFASAIVIHYSVLGGTLTLNHGELFETFSQFVIDNAPENTNTNTFTPNNPVIPADELKTDDDNIKLDLITFETTQTFTHLSSGSNPNLRVSTSANAPSLPAFMPEDYTPTTDSFIYILSSLFRSGTLLLEVGGTNESLPSAVGSHRFGSDTYFVIEAVAGKVYNIVSPDTPEYTLDISNRLSDDESKIKLLEFNQHQQGDELDILNDKNKWVTAYTETNTMTINYTDLISNARMVFATNKELTAQEQFEVPDFGSMLMTYGYLTLDNVTSKTRIMQNAEGDDLLFIEDGEIKGMAFSGPIPGRDEPYTTTNSARANAKTNPQINLGRAVQGRFGTTYVAQDGEEVFDGNMPTETGDLTLRLQMAFVLQGDGVVDDPRVDIQIPYNTHQNYTWTEDYVSKIDGSSNSVEYRVDYPWSRDGVVQPNEMRLEILAATGATTSLGAFGGHVATSVSWVEHLSRHIPAQPGSFTETVLVSGVSTGKHELMTGIEYRENNQFGGQRPEIAFTWGGVNQVTLNLNTGEDLDVVYHADYVGNAEETYVTEISGISTNARMIEYMNAAYPNRADRYLGALTTTHPSNHVFRVDGNIEFVGDDGMFYKITANPISATFTPNEVENLSLSGTTLKLEQGMGGDKSVDLASLSTAVDFSVSVDGNTFTATLDGDDTEFAPDASDVQVVVSSDGNTQTTTIDGTATEFAPTAAGSATDDGYETRILGGSTDTTATITSLAVTTGNDWRDYDVLEFAPFRGDAMTTTTTLTSISHPFFLDTSLIKSTERVSVRTSVGGSSSGRVRINIGRNTTTNELTIWSGSGSIPTTPDDANLEPMKFIKGIKYRALAPTAEVLTEAIDALPEASAYHIAEIFSQDTARNNNRAMNAALDQVHNLVSAINSPQGEFSMDLLPDGTMVKSDILENIPFLSRAWGASYIRVDNGTTGGQKYLRVFVDYIHKGLPITPRTPDGTITSTREWGFRALQTDLRSIPPSTFGSDNLLAGVNATPATAMLEFQVRVRVQAYTDNTFSTRVALESGSTFTLSFERFILSFTQLANKVGSQGNDGRGFIEPTNADANKIVAVNATGDDYALIDAPTIPNFAISDDSNTLSINVGTTIEEFAPSAGQGSQGSQGLFRVYVYLVKGQNTSAPTAPTATNYNPNNGSLVNLTDGWISSFPTNIDQSANDYWESFTTYNPATNTLSAFSEPFQLDANTGSGGGTNNYNDLTNRPDLSVYELSADAFSGAYGDLTGLPDIQTTTVSKSTDNNTLTIGIDGTNTIFSPQFSTVNAVIPTATQRTMRNLNAGQTFQITIPEGYNGVDYRFALSQTETTSIDGDNIFLYELTTTNRVISRHSNGGLRLSARLTSAGSRTIIFTPDSGTQIAFTNFITAGGIQGLQGEQGGIGPQGQTRVYIYRTQGQGVAAPATPTGGSVDAGGSVIAPSGWDNTFPASITQDTRDYWESFATYNPADGTLSAWATPFKIDVENGVAGSQVSASVSDDNNTLTVTVDSSVTTFSPAGAPALAALKGIVTDDPTDNYDPIDNLNDIQTNDVPYLIQSSGIGGANGNNLVVRSGTVGNYIYQYFTPEENQILDIVNDTTDTDDDQALLQRRVFKGGQWRRLTSGFNNTASGSQSTIAGGNGNTASGFRSVIVGGSNNTASGLVAVIPGGQVNTASGSISMAAGERTTVAEDSAFGFGTRYAIPDNSNILFGVGYGTADAATSNNFNKAFEVNRDGEIFARSLTKSSDAGKFIAVSSDGTKLESVDAPEGDSVSGSVSSDSNTFTLNVNGSLTRFSPFSSGASTPIFRVGSLGASNYPNLALIDGVLYTREDGQLYSVNPMTGLRTAIGASTDSRVTELVALNGVLYALGHRIGTQSTTFTSTTRTVYSVDIRTGILTSRTILESGGAASSSFGRGYSGRWFNLFSIAGNLYSSYSYRETSGTTTVGSGNYYVRIPTSGRVSGRSISSRPTSSGDTISNTVFGSIGSDDISIDTDGTAHIVTIVDGMITRTPMPSLNRLGANLIPDSFTSIGRNIYAVGDDGLYRIFNPAATGSNFDARTPPTLEEQSYRNLARAISINIPYEYEGVAYRFRTDDTSKDGDFIYLNELTEVDQNIARHSNSSALLNARIEGRTIIFSSDTPTLEIAFPSFLKG